MTSSSKRCAAVLSPSFARWEDLISSTLRNAGVGRAVASRLATLIVAAIEGAIVLSRGKRDIRPLHEVGRELEATVRAALPAAEVR